MHGIERLASLCLVLTALACGPATPSVSGDAETHATQTEASTSTTGDGDGDGDPTPGDGDGDPTPGDGDGDPAPVCPEPEDVRVSVSVTPPTPRTGPCTLLDHWGEDTFQQLDLDCEGEPVSVTLDSTLSTWMHPTTDLTIDYRTRELGLGTERWLAIHNAGPNGPMALALGAIDATQLDPPGTTLAAFFGSPVLSLADEQPCPALPDGLCGDVQRLALDVSHELGVGGPVFDHGSWFADFLSHGYSLDVEHAWRYEQNACEDQLDSLFRLAVTWFPSD